MRRGDLGGGGEAGPQLVGGLVEGDDDLEVLGLFGAGGGLRGGDAGGAQQRLIADQGDVALEDLAGKGVDGDVGGLADLDVDDVGLVHLDLGGDDAHVGEGHQGRAFGVLNADDDGLAFADRHVGHDAVKRGDGDGVVEHVLIGAQGGDLRLQMAARGFGLRLGLVELGHRLRDRRDVDVVGGLLGVEVLLGHDAGRVEAWARSQSSFFCSRSALACSTLASAVFSAAM